MAEVVVDVLNSNNFFSTLYDYFAWMYCIKDVIRNFKSIKVMFFEKFGVDGANFSSDVHFLQSRSKPLVPSRREDIIFASNPSVVSHDSIHHEHQNNPIQNILRIELETSHRAKYVGHYEFFQGALGYISNYFQTLELTLRFM